MDIYILHDGEQLGPLSQEAAQGLLKEGRVSGDDLAWGKGMGDWAPLLQLLDSAAERAEEPAAAPAGARPPAVGERATERQKAFLAYMGVTFSPEVTHQEAAHLVNDAMEHPKDSARAARWTEERLQLHPELFAEEIQARKEGRAQHYFEISQREGAALFTKVTKAHCQVLVGALDVQSPNWDAFEREAVWKYFFPALAEKFPKLLTDAGREKLPPGAKGRSPEHRSPRSSALRPSRSASAGARKFFAAVKGVVIGAIILGALWFGRGFLEKGTRPSGKKAATPVAAVAATPAEEGAKPASVEDASAAPAAEGAAKPASIEPAPATPAPAASPNP